MKLLNKPIACCRLAAISILAALAVAPSQSLADTLVQYAFTTTTQPTATHPNATATAFANGSLSTWEGPTTAYAYPTAPVMRVGPAGSATSASTAVANNSYCSFTLTPAGGFTFTLTNISFNVARGGSGTPRGYVVRSSIDNYAANIATADVGTVRPTWTAVSIPLSAGYQNITSVVFRLYFYSPATGSSLEFDDFTVEGSAVATSVPAAPTTAAVISRSGSVSLSWPAVFAASTYNIKRSDTSGGPYVSVGTTTSTNYTDTTVINGSLYYYVVSGSNTLGEGQNSPEVVGRPNEIVQGITAAGATRQVSLTWNSLAGATAYSVRRSTVSGGPYTAVASDLAGTTYVDSTAQDGTTYYYVVIAALGAGVESGLPQEAAGITIPGVPTLSATTWAPTVNQLKWTLGNPTVSQYILEKSTDGTTFAPLASVGTTNKFVLDTGVIAGETTFYRIQATNASGSSPYSAVVNNTTPLAGWNINFANGTAPIPAGYKQDIGETFGDRTNGLFYGWTTLGGTNITVDARLRANAQSADVRYDTFNHMMKAAANNPSQSATWELEIPNGFYWVRIVAGDPTATDSTFQFNVEGVATAARTVTTSNYWQEFTLTTQVNDGRLTVTSGPSAVNNKINFIDIYPAEAVAVAISAAPQPQSLLENRALTLSVSVTNLPPSPGIQFFGAEPITYQWYFGSEAIPGATNATYSVPNAQMAQAGQYYVVVSNPMGSVTSDPVTVAVAKDEVPPQIVSAASVDGRSIQVMFDEALNLESARDPISYAVNDGTTVTVRLAEVRPDGRSAVLYLDDAGIGALPLTNSFTLNINGVNDLAGNPMLGASVDGAIENLVAVDIGAPVTAGSDFAYAKGSFDSTAGGADIWNNADSMRYVYRQVTGDFDVKVRVNSLTRADVWTKAGLMARIDTTAGSRNVTLLTTPSTGQNAFAFQWRDAQDGVSESRSNGNAGTPTNAPTYPNTWLRLKRSGAVFTGFISTNGVNWIQHYAFDTAASTNGAFPETILVGLATTSHNNTAGVVATAEYRDFGTVAAGSPTLTVIGYSATQGFQFSMPTAAGVSYSVWFKNALSDSWQPLSTVTGNGAVQTVTDATAPAGMRFYRVTLP